MTRNNSLDLISETDLSMVYTILSEDNQADLEVDSGHRILKYFSVYIPYVL